METQFEFEQVYDASIDKIWNALTPHSLNIELGFQIYLPTRKARSIYNEASKEVKKKANNDKTEDED